MSGWMHRWLENRLPRDQAAQGLWLRALYCLYYGSLVTFLAFFNIHLRQMGLSGLQIGAIGGIRPAIVLLSQPLWGVVADSWGRRRTLSLTLLLGSVFLLGYMWSGSFWFIFAWTVPYALVHTPIGTLIDSLVLDHLGERAGRSFGSYRLWGALGWAAMALLTGRIVAGRDLRLAFAISAGLLLAGLVVAWSTRPRRGADAPTSAQRLRMGAWRGASVLLADRQFLLALVLMALVQMGISAYYAFFPIYLTEIGASRPLIGLANTLQGLGELPLYLAAGPILARLGARRALVLAMLVWALRLFLYSALRQPVVAVALGLTHGLSFSLFLVASVDYFNRQVPAEWRATGQSLYSAAFWGAGAILGSAWSGLVYDQFGVQVLFRLAGGLLVAVAAATALTLRERRA